MKKKILTLIIISTLILVLVGTTSVLGEKLQPPLAEEEGSAEGMLTATIDGYSLSVNEENLSFSLTKNGKTWHSGKRESEEDGLNSADWQARVQDAVTVSYYILSNNSERERAITRMNNTRIDCDLTSSGFKARINLREIGVKFEMQVKIKNNRVEVTVPFESIEESKTDQFLLTGLQLYPFMNSSFGQKEGYIFIPDGSGAVIDLSKQSSAKQQYRAKIYGEDFSIGTSTLSSTSPYTAQMATFGITNADVSTLTCIDGGAEYAEIQASVAGIETNYNNVSAKYVYRKAYVKYFSTTLNTSYRAIQEDKSVFDINQKTYLIDGNASVSDLAQIYRDHLLGKDYITKVTDGNGLRIQFLMAENRKSMFGNEVIPLTTAEFVDQVANELSTKVDGLAISLMGYADGGLTYSYPKHLPFESKVGSTNDFKKLFENAKTYGVDISLTCDYLVAYNDSTTLTNAMKVQDISEQFVSAFDITNRSFTTEIEYSFLNVTSAQKKFTSDAERFAKYGVEGLDLNSIGRYLMSCYKNDNYSRTELIAKYNEMLNSQQFDYAIDSPNEYLFKLATSYLSTPTENSGYIIETESVPFLQMVLSGYTTFFSSPINLNLEGDADVLKLIEYNVRPSFLLTEQPSTKLIGTNSQYIFTSEYALWKEKMMDIYNQVDQALSQVEGANFVEHTQVQEDVYKCVYSNGVVIYVNYSSSAVTVDGVTVENMSAKVVNK